ncbi:MAG TPA: hypothetical protein VK807_13760 [Gemmatimonadaceae bacterium]|nr:hypothetical protein [Gemmatimonadaceae bacterium]
MAQTVLGRVKKPYSTPRVTASDVVRSTGMGPLTATTDHSTLFGPRDPV